MAFQEYERRVLPQGGIDTPREVSIAETVGAGLQNLGQAGAGMAVDLARADQITQQKAAGAWTGEKRPQALQDLNKQIDDLQANVQPGAPGYADSVGKAIDTYQAETLKSAPNDMARADLSEYLAGLKAQYLDSARRFQSGEQIALRTASIDKASDTWGNLLVSDPSKFEDARAQMAATINSQVGGVGGLTRAKADSEIRRSEQNLSMFAMNGMAASKPRQLVAEIEAGKWNDIAEPSRLAAAKNQALSQIKADESQARIEANQQRAIAQSSFINRANDAITSMENNGGVMPLVNGKPLVDPATLPALFKDDPIQGQRIADKLRTAQTKGAVLKQLDTTTYQEDEALKAASAPKPDEIYTTDRAEINRAITTKIEAKRDAAAAEMKVTLGDSQNAAQNDIATQMPDWLQTAFASKGIPQEAIDAIAEAGYAPSKAADLRAKLQQQVELGNLQGQIADGGRIDENSAVVKSLQLDASAGGPGSAVAAEKAQILGDELNKKVAAFGGDDPAGAAIQYNSGVASSWQVWQSPPVVEGETPDQTAARKAALFRNAVRQSTVEQQRQNVPNTKPLPDVVARGIANDVMSKPNPKEQLAALLSYTNLGDETMTRQVLGQLTSQKNGLPAGTDLVIDAASDDPARAERMFAALQADTKGIELPKAAKDAITSELQSGLVGVLATQGGISGDIGSATSLAKPVRDAIEKATAAKISLGADPEQAAKDAVSDFTGQYALINDPSIGALYYPKAKEKAAPAALEAGLIAIRKDASVLPGSALPSAAKVKALNLTPQEQFLYQHHVDNITGQHGGKSVHNADGSTSTILQLNVEHDGLAYNIPSVWDGKILSEPEAKKRAAEIGWSKWPSYDTWQEADRRYLEDMHPAMDADVDAPRVNPYVADTASDIQNGANGAVWQNHQDGFALIFPGTNEVLKFVKIDEAQKRGLKELAADKNYINNALTIAPALMPGPGSGPGAGDPLQDSLLQVPGGGQ